MSSKITALYLTTTRVPGYEGLFRIEQTRDIEMEWHDKGVVINRSLLVPWPQILSVIFQEETPQVVRMFDETNAKGESANLGVPEKKKQRGYIRRSA